MSPKSIYQGGFPQNHVAGDGDDMAVHDVGSPEIDGHTGGQYSGMKHYGVRTM